MGLKQTGRVVQIGSRLWWLVLPSTKRLKEHGLHKVSAIAEPSGGAEGMEPTEADKAYRDGIRHLSATVREYSDDDGATWAAYTGDIEEEDQETFVILGRALGEYVQEVTTATLRFR